ncbi:hypothetical protein [Hymenobacter rubidus]|uniref:hypothetical protein n=1 Tax=Hymenobacter rubidus TaxID=1441626 RepID=UPI00191DBAEC|nr:hypothetical protein [Hymenobacter rubidus]
MPEDTPNSHGPWNGICTYAQRNPGAAWYPELQSRLTRLTDLREAVKGEIHRLLANDFGYFS